MSNLETVTTPAAGQAGPPVPRRADGDVASILLNTKAITPAQASRTRRIQEKLPDRSFLSIVCELGFTTEEQARKILHDNRLSVGLGSLLVEQRYIDEQRLIDYGIAHAALVETTIAEVLKNLPRMKKTRTIPELLRLTG